jgi:hypothetical protein
MKSISLLLTCLIVLLTASCGDKTVSPVQSPGPEAKIVGDWLWQESCGGIAGICFDTSSVGGIGMLFTADGKFYRYCDVCDPIEGVVYEIKQKPSFFYGPDTIVTVIELTYGDTGFVDQIITHLDDSMLSIQGDCIDCYFSTFSKIRTAGPIIVGP